MSVDIFHARQTNEDLPIIPARELKNILVVDHSPSDLSFIEQSFTAWSKGTWRTFTIDQFDFVVPNLIEHWIDAVVLDMDMPGEDSLEYLHLLHTNFPTLLKIAVSAIPSSTLRDRCLELGATSFRQKPRSIEEAKSLFSDLGSMLSPNAPGLRGMIRVDGLQEVLQWECLHRRSSVLAFDSGGEHGRVYIADGEITHAEAGPLFGDCALPRILSYKNGQFAMLPYTKPPRRTICERWEFLLLQAAHEEDESISCSQTASFASHHG